MSLCWQESLVINIFILSGYWDGSSHYFISIFIITCHYYGIGNFISTCSSFNVIIIAVVNLNQTFHNFMSLLNIFILSCHYIIYSIISSWHVLCLDNSFYFYLSIFICLFINIFLCSFSSFRLLFHIFSHVLVQCINIMIELSIKTPADV